MHIRGRTNDPQFFEDTKNRLRTELDDSWLNLGLLIRRPLLNSSRDIHVFRIRTIARVVVIDLHRVARCSS